MHHLADPDKSPSKKYARIEHGVDVPLMYDGSGKRLNLPLQPTRATTLPSFGQVNIPTSMIDPVFRLPFSSRPWKSIANGAADLVDSFNLPLWQATSTTLAAPGVIAGVAWINDAVNTLPQLQWNAIDGVSYQPAHNYVLETESLCTTFRQEVPEHERLSQDAVRDPSACRLSAFSISTSALGEQYNATVASLVTICQSKGLPTPSNWCASTMDMQGIRSYKVWIKIGRQGKNIFCSEECKLYEEAMLQAAVKTLRALEDLGMRADETFDDLTKSIVKQGRTPSESGALNKRTRNSGTTSEISVEKIGKESLAHKKVNAIDGSRVVDEILTSSPVPTRAKALQPQSQRSPRPEEKRGSKRKIDDIGVESRPAELDLKPLLRRLSLIPAAESEQRLAVVCEYIDLEEPTIKKRLNSQQHVVFVASFNSPWLSHVRGTGSTSTNALRRLNDKVMHRLNVDGVDYFTRLATRDKRNLVEERSVVYADLTRDDAELDGKQI